MCENISRICPKDSDKSLSWTPYQSARAISRYNWAVRSDRFTNSLSPYYTKKFRDKSLSLRKIINWSIVVNFFSAIVLSFNAHKEMSLINSHGLCDIPLSILGHCRFWVMLLNVLAIILMFRIKGRVS